MKNADMPAAPSKSVSDTGKPYYKDLPSTGLTKREHFAGMAMQGLLASGAHNDYMKSRTDNQIANYDWDMESFIALQSVSIANGLLHALENTKLENLGG